MAFARWDPIGDLLALQQHLDRLDRTPSGWSPPIDLYETEDRYVLTAEVPGLHRDDVRIHFQDGRLIVSGVRREEATPCEQYHRIERGRGEFNRTFQLPEAVDIDRITADLKNGLLIVEVPKSPDSPARRIRVS